MATRRSPPLLAGLLVTLLALVAGSGLGMAGDGARSTIAPVPAKGRGDKCVADTSFMRRYHISVLIHLRDYTVHDGIRTKQFSLNECIDCHAGAKTGSVASAREDFCQSCHSYAGVTLDCWDCHQPTPGRKAAAGVRP